MIAYIICGVINVYRTLNTTFNTRRRVRCVIMVNVERYGSIVTIKATAPGRKKGLMGGTNEQVFMNQVIHMACVARPGVTVGGSVGGHRCVEVIPLDKPDSNGGMSVAVVESHPEGGLVRNRYTVMGSAEEILAAFTEARKRHCLPEDQMPKVGKQTLFWKIFRAIRQRGQPTRSVRQPVPKPVQNLDNH